MKNFVDGELCKPDAVSVKPLFNPSTGEQIGEVPMSSPKESQRVIESSHKAYLSWKNTPIAKRVNFLFAMREGMMRHAEALAVAIATDQAKHISEARGEVQRVIEIIEDACSIPTLIQGQTLDHISRNINGRVTKAPLGVFGGVAPFNFPALVFGWFVPYAIGTGNTFIFKPSTQSPAFMQKMCEIFQEIDLPPGVVNVIHGDRTVVDTWYPSKEVQGICLVGSTPTAKIMAEHSGRHAKRSMLLGGAKNYLVVMEDFDEQVFVDQFVTSCFGSAGQRCLAGSVVAAVPEVYERVVELCAQAARDTSYGDALDESIFMGPVISDKARDTIFEYIDYGQNNSASKAKLVVDGRELSLKNSNTGGYFVAPTVFENYTPCNKLAQEEIFGPVAGVMKIADMNDVLQLIADSEFGNGACIFTQSLYYAETFMQQADVGMVGVNIGVPAPHPYLPFGGIKGSHLGTNKVQGKDGIDFFIQNKVSSIRFVPPEHLKGDSGTASSSGVRSCVAS